ncbi:MAG: glycosyltransferase, partial [Desulfurococcales archaeon]|nr:glycosyltransferase [Desulfurococcales archaeon]
IKKLSDMYYNGLLNCKRLENLISKDYLNKNIIYFHGILIPRRRVEDLIEAFRIIREDPECPETMLVLSGSTSFDRKYYEKIIKLISKYKLNRDVAILGEIDNETLACMYAISKVFVWPCHRQTWGIAPLEALLFGTPIVVSKTSGVSEVISDKVGVIVEPLSPEELYKGIKTILCNTSRERFDDSVLRRLVIEKYTYYHTGMYFLSLIKLVSSGNLYRRR